MPGGCPEVPGGARRLPGGCAEYAAMRGILEISEILSKIREDARNCAEICEKSLGSGKILEMRGNAPKLAKIDKKT